MFERILIANRGEVGARVARTCRRLGVETVGVHVSGEETDVHVEACDESVCIGDDPSAYRDIEKLAIVASESNVHAVHPGYGLLSNEPRFAAAIESRGLIFVGPAAERFEDARDRLAVRAAAIESGVRVLRGSARPILEAAEALEDAEELDYPLVLKPIQGVGEVSTLAMISDADELHGALASYTPLHESGGVYLERYVPMARHVEVQLVFDGVDTVVLGDREVSLRREYQRVLSESPAPALDQLYHREAVRGAVWDAASEITQRLGCRGLATCKFLIDPSGVFTFSSFTPALTVEHPTTEMCCRLDLVELQLRLAAGESAPSEVLRVEPRGAALQARIDAASDPGTGLLFPTRVDDARWPPAPQGKVRIETGVKVGSEIDPAHSSLLATVTTYAPTRHDALLMLDRVIAEIHLEPVTTNQRLLRKALNHESLRAGQYDEDFLDRI